MGFNVTKGVCDECQGVSKCTKLCALHTATSLAEFIQRVDVIETKIGEYSSRKPGTKPDLIFSGHQLFDINQPSWLLSDIKTTSLDANSKFKSAYGKTVLQLISLWARENNISDEMSRDILEKLRGINKNKLLVLPFKPRTKCYVDYSPSEKRVAAEISNLKWTTNKTNYKLECMITFDDGNHKPLKLSILDYITKFKLERFDIQQKLTKNAVKLIKVTDHGLFKPIVVKDKHLSVMLDGSYLYYEFNHETSIIGFWNEYGTLTLLNNQLKSNALKLIMDNIDVIKLHRKYIAPYLLYEENIIEL